MGDDDYDYFVRDNYIVVMLQEAQEDNTNKVHIYSIILDFKDLMAKFDMEEVMFFLEDAKLDYLIQAFKDAKYIP